MPETRPTAPLSPVETLPGEGRLEVRLPDWNAPLKPGAVRVPPVLWLRLTATTRAAPARYAPDLRTLQGLKPGTYRLQVLLADSSLLAPVMPILIRANGTTYVQLLATERQLPGQGSRDFLRQLKHDFALPPVTPPRREIRTEMPSSRPDFWETVVGRIVDASSGEALPGVTVLVKGTTLGTSTNADGRFELAVPRATVTLTISSIGYGVQELAAHAGQQVSVEMRVEAKHLDEVVVVGYNAQRRSDRTGAVSIVSGLSGRVNGVIVNENGGTDKRVTIRGTSSFAGVPPPLLIVDGLPVSFSLASLDPALIASTKILKGPEAAGLFGSRAAGGVIIITTKAGGAAIADPGSDPRLALRRRPWW
jgi:TonB-dependent SusC/RagA subfamily outer membrane receptor